MPLSARNGELVLTASYVFDSLGLGIEVQVLDNKNTYKSCFLHMSTISRTQSRNLPLCMS